MCWTIRTKNKCWECVHMQKSVYMQLEEETLYNCWCKVADMDNKEKCDKFESGEYKR